MLNNVKLLKKSLKNFRIWKFNIIFVPLKDKVKNG